ncbi:MAG: LacI family DNA-binding transcriptional regulator [Armatimonadota bacterium]
MTTIRKLAQLAGVSTATVMRTLRNDPHVAPQTRDKVLELAALYSYHPRNTLAVPQETNLIGCIVPKVSSLVFSRVLEGVLEEAFAESYRAIVLETHNNVTHTCKALDTLIEHRVSGVLLAAGHVDLIPGSYLLTLWSQGVHVVVVDDNVFNSPNDIDTVLNDFHDLACTGIKYLHDLGHRSIAYVGYLTRVIDGKSTREATHFQQVLREYKLSTKWMVDTMHQTRVEDILDILLVRSDPPTAIITISDTIAAQLINDLARRGWQVPADMSVMGIGNFTFCELINPKVTSIEQSLTEMGERAAALLFSRISSDAHPATCMKEHILIPARMMVRDSCGRPRR